MSKFIVIVLLIISCVGICSGQRYVVDIKKGNEKFALAQKIGGEWTQTNTLSRLTVALQWVR